MDLSHLDAIELRLSHERARVASAERPREIEFRKAEVASIEKELVAEKRFLGLPATLDEILMSDDELLAALAS